jgi:hypothetical protein
MLMKRINSGTHIPAWFGVAWTEAHADQSVCMPIPLNVLAHWLRGAWHWLRWGYMPVACSPREAFAQGAAFALHKAAPDTSLDMRENFLWAADRLRKVLAGEAVRDADEVIARADRLNPPTNPDTNTET